MARSTTKKAPAKSAGKKKKVVKPPTPSPPASSDEEQEESENEVDDNSEGEEFTDGKTFTDDNQKWLKMKGDDSASEDDEADSDSEASISQIERDAMALDAEKEEEVKEFEEDLQRQRQEMTKVFHLPTAEELEEDEDRVVPPSEIRERVEEIIEVMQDFKRRREPSRSRTEYMDQLESDLSEYFGYLPELISLFLKMFSPSEALEFLDASDKPRPLVIRTNTLKARRKDLAQALIKRGVNLDPLAPWSKVGLKIYESTVPIGATPEYLSGHYMLQSAASMCPVMALEPQPGEKVLDMSSAPGGKTSYVSQLMKNEGIVVANDLKVERQKATVGNLHRLGVKNVITCCNDGKNFPKVMGNFDRVLLDAPCSGLGVISRDQSIKVQRTVKDIERTAHLQKELLLSGIDSLNAKSKTGGIMVYSTCSVSVQENEQVVQYILNKRDVKLVDTGLKHGKPGFQRYQERRFHPSMQLTRRFYPHTHNMDGFFVAKFRKLSNKERIPPPEEVEDEEVSGEEEEDVEMDVEEDEEEVSEEKKALRAKFMSGIVKPEDDEEIDSEEETKKSENKPKKERWEKIKKGKKKKGEKVVKEQKSKQVAGKKKSGGGGGPEKKKAKK
ncbi:hypothetical protein TrLO_g10910 [Triparma laevis f. longispina]|uniref:SAM-dependent MTase RsmB/NOP-type domain-containing protein n=1 Tax=Triparma laevis f. longispina TaxID=1714387 RepID=A0A9W6ZUH3_9STRA|nr:hypothetical protein TrLO_g10910 [Triparma laevis f. longispina]